MNLKYGTKKVPFLNMGAHSQATPAIVACYRDHLRDYGIAGDFSNLFSPSSNKLWQQTVWLVASCRGLWYAPVEGFWNGNGNGNPHQQDEGKKGEFAMRGIHQEK